MTMSTHLYGKKVFFSDLAIVKVPVKKSKNKRIQKKYIKRYGCKNVPGVIMSDAAIFIHTNLKNKFESALDINKPEPPQDEKATSR